MRSCVHCGRQREQHGPNLECVGSAGRSGNHFGSLDLPDGLTCGDCVHIRRCQAIFGHKPEDTYCDWFPIRFALRAPQPVETLTIGEMR